MIRALLMLPLALPLLSAAPLEKPARKACVIQSTVASPVVRDDTHLIITRQISMTHTSAPRRTS